MGLVTPDYGTIFWMVLSFSIVLFVLGKFAWPAILNGLKEREASISEALQSAEKAKEEMQKLKADNERIMRKAREDRDELLKEARDIKNKMIESAKAEAQKEAAIMIEAAKQVINSEKISAINEIKMQVANLSIEISEKILKKELTGDKNQEELINKMLNDFKLN
ncbi:MAG: F0F1 ATP synthase subunit B [Chlorobi bacterium]|nr:F0F1 ATP synthase subunit B [Chlorobiota bacterium]